MVWRRFLFAAIALSAALAVRADELTLKDGSKIEGTIVGFEAKSFKVKTSYGFAVVRKDQVASIRMTGSSEASVVAQKPAAEKNKVGPATKLKSGAVSAKPASSPPERATSVPAPPVPTSRADANAASSRRPAAQATAAHAPVAVNVSSPPASAAPVAQPAPLAVREEVTGNTYVNETYGFSMFKPPDWELIEGARAMLPGAITALGTDDQTTYLLIGQDPAGKSIESQMNATVGRLGSIMDNFRPLGETRLSISGSPAIERRFHGIVDQHDWSGVIVLIPHDSRVFTIFGMTYAETDLVQIQENVIARTISSIHFVR
jgi:hypothetical protein